MLAVMDEWVESRCGIMVTNDQRFWPDSLGEGRGTRYHCSVVPRVWGPRGHREC